MRTSTGKCGQVQYVSQARSLRREGKNGGAGYQIRVSRERLERGVYHLTIDPLLHEEKDVKGALFVRLPRFLADSLLKDGCLFCN